MADTVLQWITSHLDVIAILILFTLLCGIAVGTAVSIWYVWSAWFRSPLLKLWNRIVRNPTTRLLGPLRRAWTRRAANTLRDNMAKWRKGHLANAFYETIHREIEAGRLSPQQGKQLQSQMAKFFGVDDLARIKTHADAIKHRLLLNKEYEIGPKGPIPGDDTLDSKGNVSVYVPKYKFEGLGAKFLKKKGTA